MAEQFFVQFKSTAKLADPKRPWGTMRRFETRGAADASAASFKSTLPSIEMIKPGRTNPISRVSRRVWGFLLRGFGREDPWAEFRGARTLAGGRFEARRLGRVPVTYRVVSTTELRAEGEAAFRRAEMQACIGQRVWPGDDEPDR